MPENNIPSPGESRFGPVTLLEGPGRGRYPEGNSLLVEGTRESVIIDPSLGLLGRAEPPPQVSRVLNSHCHEDHIAGNHLFPDVPWHMHALDAPGLHSIDAFLEIYGFPPGIEDPFREVLLKEFHFVAREDPEIIGEGDVFDLGGVRIRVMHTPGHTRGHCCFLIDWDKGDAETRMLYLGDIELTRFGPYYGDAWSSLPDFESSLRRVREVQAHWYATFHHIGVLEGRDAYLQRLDVFEAKIAEREERLLDFLTEPHDMREIVSHRFIYRPGDDVSFADGVEQRSMEQHLERLIESGRVRSLDGERFERI